MNSLLKKQIFFFCLAALMTMPLMSHASPRVILKCTSFGSYESFELTPPIAGNTSAFRIVDMASIEPMNLILKGKVTADKFDVQAERPSFRLGETKIGRLIGEKQNEQLWKMAWYPIGTSLNGSKRLLFDCESND